MPAQTVGCAPLGAHALFVLNACLKDDFCFEEKRFVCFRQALRVGNAFAPEGKSSIANKLNFCHPVFMQITHQYTGYDAFV